MEKLLYLCPNPINNGMSKSKDKKKARVIKLPPGIGRSVYPDKECKDVNDWFQYIQKEYEKTRKIKA